MNFLEFDFSDTKVECIRFFMRCFEEGSDLGSIADSGTSCRRTRKRPVIDVLVVSRAVIRFGNGK